MSQFFVNSAGGVSPTGDLHVAKWIVNSSGAGSGGNQTTIQAAITAASAGDTIFVMPGATGIYTENLTLKAGVNIVAFRGDEEIPNVTIVGTLTMTTAGTVSISNIRLQTNASFALSVTGSAASIVNIENCYFNITNNTGINFTSSNSSATINIYDCTGDIRSTGIALFSSSSPGTINIYYSSITNTGGSSTANTASAGTIQLQNSRITNPITTSGTAGISTTFTSVTSEAQNVTALTIGGSSNGAVYESFVLGGTASAISISSQASVVSSNISSNNTNAISGAGTIIYSGLTFIGTSSTINVTTQVAAGTLQGSKNTAPTAGFLGEQITASATAVSVSNGIAKTITSINLTPGVWDVSCIGFANNTSTAGTVMILSLSTVTNTVTGAQGDSDFQCNTGTFATLSGVVPQKRATISATTTYYAVMSVGFGGGTTTCNARITGTRVG